MPSLLLRFTPKARAIKYGRPVRFRQLVARGDRADDPGAVRMHGVAAADGVEGADDHPAGQLRMRGVGAGIDYGDRTLLPVASLCASASRIFAGVY